MSDEVTIEAIFEGIDIAVADAVSLTTLRVADKLAHASPIKTGNLSASWIPSPGAPFEGQASTPEAVSTAAQEAGVVAMLGYELDQGIAYVSNNVDYLEHVVERFDPPISAAIEEAVAEAIELGRQIAAPLSGPDDGRRRDQLGRFK